MIENSKNINYYVERYLSPSSIFIHFTNFSVCPQPKAFPRGGQHHQFLIHFPDIFNASQANMNIYFTFYKYVCHTLLFSVEVSH